MVNRRILVMFVSDFNPLTTPVVKEAPFKNRCGSTWPRWPMTVRKKLHIFSIEVIHAFSRRSYIWANCTVLLLLVREKTTISWLYRNAYCRFTGNKIKSVVLWNVLARFLSCTEFVWARAVHDASWKSFCVDCPPRPQLSNNHCWFLSYRILLAIQVCRYIRSVEVSKTSIILI